MFLRSIWQLVFEYCYDRIDINIYIYFISLDYNIVIMRNIKNMHYQCVSVRINSRSNNKASGSIKCLKWVNWICSCFWRIKQTVDSHELICTTHVHVLLNIWDKNKEPTKISPSVNPKGWFREIRSFDGKSPARCQKHWQHDRKNVWKFEHGNSIRK